MRRAFKAIIALGMFFLLSYGATFFVGIIINFIETNRWVPLSFNDSISMIMTGGKPFQMWLLLEIISLAISVYIFFSNNDYYKAKQYKVTDRISIPVPAGQGQHGTAWFASKKELHRRYARLKINEKDSLIQQLLQDGKKRYAEVREYAHKKARAGKKNKHKRTAETVKIERGFIVRKQSSKPEKEKRKISPVKKLRDKLIEKEQDFLFSFQNLLPFRTVRKIKEKHMQKKAEKEMMKIESRQAGQTADKAPQPQEKNYFNTGGLVIDEPDRKTFYCVAEDKHTLINGSTGSGKTRNVVLPSICTLALAGESIIAVDIKGELNAYTSDYLKRLGYQVTVLNFFDTTKSDKYNLLQPIIDAVNDDNISLAVTRAWDLTTFLVEKSDRTEPIWRNGEMSIIAAAILCVVYDNRSHPEFQNLTNVYYFIAEMFRDYPGEGKKPVKPIDIYLDERPADHPARGLLGISMVAPDKTAGSFYTSALTTLQLFTSPEIFSITNKSDADLSDFGRQKHALFFVLPESKTTYYPIVTLICSQIYDILTESAKRNGNRLKRRVNFLLDEFGNFSKIADFTNMLTVGRGYGIRYNLFVQSFAQLEEKYGKTALTTIQDNCMWIYLAAGAQETLDAWEKRCGEYTTTSYSLGGSIQHRSSYSSSSNVSLTGRALLKATEIGQIGRPYVLSVENQQRPAITRLPDLSQLIYNDMLGLGSFKHNEALIEMAAEGTKTSTEKVALWGVWEVYKKKIQSRNRGQLNF